MKEKFKNIKSYKIYSMLVVSFLLLFGLNITVNAAEVTVNTWNEFTTAMSDDSISQINLGNDLSATNGNTITNLTRDLTINGNGYKLDFGKAANTNSPSIILENTSNNKNLKFSNIIITGQSLYNSPTSAQARVERNYPILLVSDENNNDKWTINLDNVTTDSGITRRFVVNPLGNLVISGENELNQDKSTWIATGDSIANYAMVMFEVKKTTISKNSKVTSNLGNYFLFSDKDNAEINIDGGSVTSSNSNTGFLDFEGKQSKINVINGGELILTNGIRAASSGAIGAAITINGANSEFNVLDNSLFKVTSDYQPAAVLQSENGVFNVKKSSKIDFQTLHQRTASSTLSAVLRFRLVGGMTFNIEDDSEIYIKAHEGNSMQGVRMYGVKNNIYIKGGSAFTVVHSGSGTAVNMSDGGGTDNQFLLLDKGSRVNITSVGGTGIEASSRFIMLGEKDTEFNVTASGQAVTAGTGSIFETNQMYYYNFQNNAKSRVFSRYVGVSSVSSDSSFWKLNSNLKDNPDYTWELANIGTDTSNATNALSSFEIQHLPSLLGQNIITTPAAYTTLNTNGSRLSQMARFSGNNAAPVVDEIRVPTNADKYVYLHALVPEGYVDPPRDTWDGETRVEIEVTKKNGEVYKLFGVSEKDTEIYGEDPRDGIIKIENRNSEFFEEGDSIKVIKAWRGKSESNPTTTTDHIGYPTDNDLWVKDSVVAIDVTPPKQVVSETKLTNSTKQLSGTSSSNGDKVFFKLNGQWLVDSNNVPISDVIKNGKWEVYLPSYVEKEDKIDVYIKDNTEISPTPSYKLPETYTQEPDGVWGNISVNIDGYSSYEGYHDAIKEGDTDLRFDSALRLTALDVLPDKPELIKGYTSSNNDTVQVGDTLTYTLTAKNGKESTFDTNWKNVVITDTLPEGVTFTKEKSNMSVDGVKILDTDYEYDESTHTIKVPVGNLTSQQSVEISFDVKVNTKSVGDSITNKANVIGDSPREKVFVVGPEDEANTKETYSAEAQITTSEIFGTVELISAPENIDFGSISYNAKKKRVDDGSYDKDLIVSDTRAKKSKWKLGAKLISQMTKIDDPSVQLTDSLQYVYGNETIILSSDLQRIYESDSTTPTGDTINISETWGKTESANGIKLVVDPAKSKVYAGKYQGEIEWQLMEATP